MIWFLTAVLCALLVELALRLPFRRAMLKVTESGSKATRLVKAKAISDHWKEKAMASYAQTTFLSTLKLAGLLITVFCVAVSVVLFFNQLLDGFQVFILSWRGIVCSIVFASLYVKVRRSIAYG